MSILLASLLLSSVGQLDEEVRPLATVIVGSPSQADAPHISISMIGAQVPETRREWEERSWIAERRIGDASEVVTSEACPALTEVAQAFKDLPPITPTPEAANVRSEPFPVNSIMFGGWRTVIQFQTAGGAEVSVGGTDAYGSWGSRVVNELAPCWGTPSN